jgi:hypothetical protein
MEGELALKVFINLLKDQVSKDLFHDISVKNGVKINKSLLIRHGKNSELRIHH